jgi:DNA-directed RNA polymerase specialized sigma24 family protein
LNFVLEGFSAAEIGRLLEISSDAAGVRLHRLREKIRNHLKRKGI